jgi:hypothetical protein
LQQVGKPNLFVTFTCNPSWAELKEAVAASGQPGQKASDRPDLVTRVFRMKLDAFLADLLEKGYCGMVIADLWVIEFQKRGLPHAHILIILHPSSRAVTPDEIDATICAELPDPEAEPQLYATVRRPICGNLYLLTIEIQ